jgi:hypothetical protein
MKDAGIEGKGYRRLHPWPACESEVFKTLNPNVFDPYRIGIRGKPSWHVEQACSTSLGTQHLHKNENRQNRFCNFMQDFAKPVSDLPGAATVDDMAGASPMVVTMAQAQTNCKGEYINVQ